MCTVRNFIKRSGCILLEPWIEEVKKWSCVEINFVNTNDQNDATQFDIENVTSKQGQKDLTNLFEEFCKENDFKLNSVTCITIVATADTHGELEKLTP